MNKQEYQEYKQRVQHYFKGVEHINTGPCSTCSECLECDTPEDPDNEWYDLASEPSFSWSPCEVCNSQLGGNRYPGHFIIDNNIVHFECCDDCYYFLNYDRLDDMSMDQIENS